MEEKKYTLLDLIKLTEAAPSKVKGISNVFTDIFNINGAMSLPKRIMVGKEQGRISSIVYASLIQDPAIKNKVIKILTPNNLPNIQKLWQGVQKQKQFYNLTPVEIIPLQDGNIQINFFTKEEQETEEGRPKITLPLLKRILILQFQFTVIKDILDNYKEQLLSQLGQNPSVNSLMIFNNKFFTNKNIQGFLNSGLQQSVPAINSILGEWLSGYGQVLNENYLKFYDILEEKEIDKIKSLSELSLLTEEFLLPYLTRIYKTLGNFIKNNMGKQAVNIIVNLLQGKSEEDFTKSVYNSLLGLKDYFNNIINKNKNNINFFKEYVGILDKSINTYTEKVKNPITPALEKALQTPRKKTTGIE